MAPLGVAVILLGFFALFALLEFGYRKFTTGSFTLEADMWADDPDLLYRLNPANRDFPGSFRGKAPGATPVGEHAVICMGGSTTYGHNVREQEAWPRVLEGVLRTASVPAEVFNAGVPGYGMRQLLLRYRRDIEPLRPQMVIIDAGWNRCGRLVDPDGWTPYGVTIDGAGIRMGRVLANHSVLFRHGLQHLAEWQSAWRSHDWTGDRYHDVFASDLRSLVKSVIATGAKPVLVLYPALFYTGISPEEIQLFAPKLWEHRSYNPEMLEEVARKHAAIRAVAAETDATLVDEQARFETYRGRERMALFLDSVHLSVLGNRKVAEAIAEVIAPIFSRTHPSDSTPGQDARVGGTG